MAQTSLDFASQSMRDSKVTVMTATDRAQTGFLKCFGLLISNLIASRELVVVLFKRDFFAVYKKSFLGLTWLAITPILGVLSWVFLSFTNVLNPGEMSIPYPAFVLISTSFWTLFIGFYNAAADTLASGSGFILQVKYPHEVLLVKQVAQHLAASLINFSVMFVVLSMFGIWPSLEAVVAIPFLLLPALLLGTGIGLVISVFSVVLQEAKRFMDIFMNLLIWITPIVYTSNFDNPTLQSVVKWNPLTYLVAGVRDFFISGTMLHWDRFLISAAVSLLVFMFSWRVFYLSEDRVIEKMV